jgi:predicted ATPase
MLTQFRFENFKSWRDTGEIRIAPLTGIFGTNSSGKTAILQFLLMLKQTIESSDQNLPLNFGNDQSHTNLGASYDIVHKHKLPEKIKFSLNWKPYFPPLSFWSDEADLVKISLKVKNEFEFGSTILFDTNRIKINESYYKFKDSENQLNKIKIEVSPDSDGKTYYYSREGNTFENYHEQSLDIRVKSIFNFPLQITLDTAIRNSLILYLQQLFEQIYYLGPLREYPRRSYLWSGEQPQSVGKKGEFIVSALLASRNNNLNVEENVAYWLKELGLIHDFQIQPIAENRSDYEIKVRRFPDSPEVLITDVGFGVSQILPVLVLCYYVSEGSTIIFEQPEIHLHPSVQAGLADVFIDVIKTRNVQIILESHSEHLLRRLQRRIAEEHKDMKPEDAALYFCSIDDTGTSKLTELELDTYGNINNWPQGFFGDEMGDLVAMTEAAIRRQTANN